MRAVTVSVQQCDLRSQVDSALRAIVTGVRVVDTAGQLRYAPADNRVARSRASQGLVCGNQIPAGDVGVLLSLRELSIRSPLLQGWSADSMPDMSYYAETV